MTQPRFVTGSLWRHIIVMTVTSAFGLTFTFLIDFLTLYWLGRLDNDAMTASVAIAGAVMFASISVSIGFMIPAVALVSRALGHGDMDRARKNATASMITAFVATSIIAALLLVFLEPMLGFLDRGSAPEVRDFARQFMRIIIPSIPFFGLAMSASAILRANGDGVRSMYVTLAGGAIAMIMDPILIYLLELNVVGAAIVVNLSRIGMTAVGLYYVIRVHKLLAPVKSIQWKRFLVTFFAIAIPALLTQLSTPIGNFILTREISEFGEKALAGYAVNFRLMLLVFGGVFALSGAIGGIIGQNYGAGQLDRVKEGYLKSIAFGAIYAFIGWLILLAIRPFVGGIFRIDGLSVDVTNAFVYTAIHFVFVSALFVSNAAFNNLGRPLYSTGLNWFRDTVMTYPAAILLAGIYGAVGVVYAQALVGAIVGTAAAIIGWRFIGRVERGEIQVKEHGQ